MASTRRKSAAIALAVIGIAGLSLAAAAQLNVNSSTLGAGSTIVAACDTTGIDVNYTVLGSNVTEVKLSNVDAACNTDPYAIQLLTGTSPTQTPLGAEVVGASLAVVTGNVTIPLGVGNAQPVASVTGISIVIH